MNERVAPLRPPQRAEQGQRAFVCRHCVSFEETNVVGNVYFARHVAWQGRCREMFLKEHAPEIMHELRQDLQLITLRVSCEYYEELEGLDEIAVEMRLSYLRQHRIGLRFDYILATRLAGVLAARGFQEIACFRKRGLTRVAIEPPPALRLALAPYLPTT